MHPPASSKIPKYSGAKVKSKALIEMIIQKNFICPDPRGPWPSLTLIWTWIPPGPPTVVTAVEPDALNVDKADFGGASFSGEREKLQVVTARLKSD